MAASRLPPLVVSPPPGLTPRCVHPIPSSAAAGSTSSFNLGDNEKRWLVVGICLNKLLLPTLRQFIAPEIQKHYNHHKTTYNIHSQMFPRQLTKDNGVGFEFNYNSINGNFTNHKNKKKAYNYDVTSAVEFAKLYLLPSMAKLTGFDDTCDMSAVLGILASASVFAHVQKNAKDVRQDVRNEWGHCNFSTWDAMKFARCFQLMDCFLRSLKLSAHEQKKLVDELGDWETKGVQLCMGNLVDVDLMKLISGEVATLSDNLQEMAQTNNEELSKVASELQNVQQAIQDFDKRIEQQNHQIEELSTAYTGLALNVDCLQSEQHEIKYDVTKLNDDQQCLHHDISDVKNEQRELGNRVDEVENRQEKLEDRVESLEKSDVRRVNTFQAPNRIPSFCGRVSELNFLAQALEEQDAPHCFFSIISGLGGTGKTSLALEHVWSNRSAYDGGVFWISGESNRSFHVTLTEMARQIGTSADELSQTLSNTLDWLQTREQYWCLVVDNLDELKLSNEILKLLNGQWRRSACGHIIITTRREKTRIAEDIQDVGEDRCLEFKSFTESDSVAFMKLKTERSNTDEELIIVELVRELGCLPLALDQAGAYIHRLGCTFHKYKTEYEMKKLTLLKRFKARYIDSEERRSVHTTWQLNFDYVVQQSKDLGLGEGVSLVMNISAFLSPDDIPHEIINQGLPHLIEKSLEECASSSLVASEIVTLLTNFSLFQRFTDSSFCVHRIVQEVIRSKIDQKEMELILASATRMLNCAFSKARKPIDVCQNFKGEAVFIEENPPSLQLWGKLSAHACVLQEHLINYADKNSSIESIIYTEEAARLFYEASVFLSACKEKVKAQELQRRKLEVLVHLQNPPTDEHFDYLKYFEIPLKDTDYKLISHCLAAVETGEEVEDMQDAVKGELDEKVDILREKGNSAFKEQDFRKALDLYTEGILISSADHRLFANRALCHLKLSQPSKALEDCETSLRLQKCYNKALLRKAWALHDMAKQNPDDKHLRCRSLAAAAVASHVDPTVRMFPELHYFEISNPLDLTSRLLMSIPQMTLLLHDGDYTLQQACIDKDIQIVGLPGSHVSLKLESNFTIMGANCCLENITVLAERGTLTCLMGGSLTLQRCDISGGKIGCEGFPDCDGGPGCIADGFVDKQPCNRKGKFGDSVPSGFEGEPGIVISAGCRAYIKDCDIHSCGGYGALCCGEGASIVIISCHVHKNHNAGLSATTGGSLDVKDCDIFANNYHGVLIGHDSDSCHIANSRIFENHLQGVRCYCNEKLLTVKESRIYHNHRYGLSLDGCNVEITQNQIFDNGFYGVLAKAKTTALISENDIFSNKCGGIQIGINFSGRVVIESNTVRDHSGPWLDGASFDDRCYDTFGNKSTNLMPRGETQVYSTPPTIVGNTVKNNEEGIYHPTMQTKAMSLQCAFCRLTGKLKRCSKCNIARYCSRICQERHWRKHKVMCKAVAGRYSKTLTLIPLNEALNDQHGTDNQQDTNTVTVQFSMYGGHLKGIGEGPKPDTQSTKRFTVKVQTLQQNSHPHQLIQVYDKSLSLNAFIQSPEIFHLITECGVLGQLNKFTSKKVFLWATFAEGGKKLTVHLDDLAPYQEW